MEEIEVVLERYEQRIKTLERDMSEMKGVQAKIRSMNETLVTLATELKHTNEHLAKHERKIEAIVTHQVKIQARSLFGCRFSNSCLSYSL